MPIPDDWKPLASFGPGAYLADREAGNRLEGAQSLNLHTGGGSADQLVALVRRSRGFATPARASLHAWWVKPSTTNVHYQGVMLRNQSAATSAEGVVMSDVTGLPSYFVRVDRFANLEILRGGVSLSQTKVYPAGAAVVAPALGAVSGGLYFRARMEEEGGAPKITLSQSDLAAPSLNNEAHWTELAVYVDEDAEAITAPGYAGLVLLNGGVNAHAWYIDRYLDRRVA